MHATQSLWCLLDCIVVLSCQNDRYTLTTWQLILLEQVREMLSIEWCMGCSIIRYKMFYLVGLQTKNISLLGAIIPTIMMLWHTKSWFTRILPKGTTLFTTTHCGCICSSFILDHSMANIYQHNLDKHSINISVINNGNAPESLLDISCVQIHYTFTPYNWLYCTHVEQ